MLIVNNYVCQDYLSLFEDKEKKIVENSKYAIPDYQLHQIFNYVYNHHKQTYYACNRYCCFEQHLYIFEFHIIQVLQTRILHQEEHRIQQQDIVFRYNLCRTD